MAVPRSAIRPGGRVAADTPASDARGKSVAQPEAAGGYLNRGADARRIAHAEAERAANAAVSGIWRFKLRNKAENDSVTGAPLHECGIIILDNSIDDSVGRWEHDLKIEDTYGNIEACPKEFANCAVCEGGDHPYYVLYLSVLVLRPWRSRDGMKKGEWTKMLLPIKSSYIAKFEEYCNAAMKKFGTLRGTYFYMRRDTTNPKSRAIGEPAILDDGTIFSHYAEKQLVAEFGNPQIDGKQGKVLKAENADITPFDYNRIFPKPNPSELRQRFGGAPQAGSSEQAAEAWSEAGAGDRTQAPPRPRPAPFTQRPSDVPEAPDGTIAEQPVDDNPDNLPF